MTHLLREFETTDRTATPPSRLDVFLVRRSNVRKDLVLGQKARKLVIEAVDHIGGGRREPFETCDRLGNGLVDETRHRPFDSDQISGVLNDDQAISFDELRCQIGTHFHELIATEGNQLALDKSCQSPRRIRNLTVGHEH